MISKNRSASFNPEEEIFNEENMKKINKNFKRK